MELAIRVNNKFQFDAVLDKYHRKDWRDFIGKYSEPCYITVGEDFTKVKFYGDKGDSYCQLPDSIDIVSFKNFSTLTGVKAIEEIIVKVNPVETKVTKDGCRFEKSIDLMSSVFIKEVYLAMISLQ